MVQEIISCKPIVYFVPCNSELNLCRGVCMYVCVFHFKINAFSTFHSLLCKYFEDNTYTDLYDNLSNFCFLGI